MENENKPASVVSDEMVAAAQCELGFAVSDGEVRHALEVASFVALSEIAALKAALSEAGKSIDGWRQDNAGLRAAMKVMQEFDRQAKDEIAALKKERDNNGKFLGELLGERDQLKKELEELKSGSFNPYWQEFQAMRHSRDQLKKDLEIARAERDRAILETRKEIEATVKDYRFKSAQITLNALNTYAKHRPNCRHNPHVRTEYAEPCVCGLSEAFREIQDALGPFRLPSPPANEGRGG